MWGGWIADPNKDSWIQLHQAKCNCMGFSDCSSSDCLTDEQMEDQIAENIFDWWISGVSYKKWYAMKFLQGKLNFE